MNTPEFMSEKYLNLESAVQNQANLVELLDDQNAPAAVQIEASKNLSALRQELRIESDLCLTGKANVIGGVFVRTENGDDFTTVEG